MGLPREVLGLLAEAVPLGSPEEASLGVRVCSTHPGQFQFSFMGNGHLHYR